MLQNTMHNCANWNGFEIKNSEVWGLPRPWAPHPPDRLPDGVLSFLSIPLVLRQLAESLDLMPTDPLAPDPTVLVGRGGGGGGGLLL